LTYYVSQQQSEWLVLEQSKLLHINDQFSENAAWFGITKFFSRDIRKKNFTAALDRQLAIFRSEPGLQRSKLRAGNPWYGRRVRHESWLAHVEIISSQKISEAFRKYQQRSESIRSV
jgi:hypothetical protein